MNFRKRACYFKKSGFSERIKRKKPTTPSVPLSQNYSTGDVEHECVYLALLILFGIVYKYL